MIVDFKETREKGWSGRKENVKLDVRDYIHTRK